MKFTCDTNVLVDVLRDPSAEDAFSVFLSRFSHVTYLSAVVILELRRRARIGHRRRAELDRRTEEDQIVRGVQSRELRLLIR